MPSASLTFGQATEICWPVLRTAQETLAETRIPANQTCSKGCGACCHSALISSTSLEAFGILVAWIGSGKALEDLAQRCHTYVGHYLNFRDRSGHLPFSLGARRLFMKERLACPLFSHSAGLFAGSCGFFEHRPLICSTYHSLGPAAGCATLEPHPVDGTYMATGTELSESLRSFERKIFGKSALGHLPILLASLVTKDGLAAFLQTQDPATDDKRSQEERDFSFLLTLYDAAGVALTAADLEDLITAQSEIATR